MFKLNLAKRLSKKQKEEITLSFKDGKNIEELSKKYNCTNLTIARNLKKNLGEKNFKELVNKNKKKIKNNDIKVNENIEKYDIELISNNANNIFNEIDKSCTDQYDNNSSPFSEFIEISPLDCQIENASRKEISSVSINEVTLPKVVYMIVDKNIELEIKLLKNYPDWEFLPKEDLNRKTIEIYFDIKTAKRFCSKEKKVIKVPNTDVFRIVSPILISRGISRIVSEDKLIAL